MELENYLKGKEIKIPLFLFLKSCYYIILEQNTFF